MSSPGFTLRDPQGRRLGIVSVPTVLGWLAVVTPVLVAVERTLASSTADRPAWWPAVVIALLAIASADLPDGNLPLLTIVVVAIWWIVAVDQPAVPSAVVVALALLVFHVATSHAATGSPGRDEDPAVARALVLRVALVGATTVALGLIAGAATDRVVVPPVVLGLALLGAAALPWVAGRWPRSGPDY